MSRCFDSNGKCKQFANLADKMSILNDDKILNLEKSFYPCNMTKLPKCLQEFIEEKARICQPDKIHICDGSQDEYIALLELLENNGSICRLEKMENW